jgi:hemoglobin
MTSNMICDAVAGEVTRDLADRDDVYALLSRFYGQVLVDDLLAEPFTEVHAKGLAAHLPVMCDFWETMLFGARLYQRSALEVHREVHHNHPLTHRHFIRWLTIWLDTVDAMYVGPVAERAKVQGRRIAWAMHRRLCGGDASPSLLSL